MNANERDILLDVKNLHTHFISGHGKTKVTVKAVNGVSFQVKSGKTTLGRTIIRLYNPSSGEVTFGGRIISGKKDAELQKFLTSNIAMVFQDPIASLNPRMTVQEIIAEGLKIKGIKDEATVRNMVGEALYRVGLLPEHATRYPHEFSGGQRQRIGIARALIVEPTMVIADEPISALDVSIQAQVINVLNDLKREDVAKVLYERGMSILESKEQKYGAPMMRELERICLLRNVDSKWMEHIDNMDQLKQGMSLRGYGQRDPIVEYRIEGFDEMIATIREDAVHMLLTIEVRQQNQEPKREQVAKPTGEGAPAQAGAKGATPVRVTKIGRNDPCPCGSGLKWKKCTCKEYHPDL